MKEEAAANAESDRIALEKVEKLNHADTLIFQTEKQLKEFGDKLPSDKKGPIEAALAKLKEAHKNQDVAAIDSATAELNTVFQAASQEMYNAAGAQGEPAGAQGGAQSSQKHGSKGDGEVTDGDHLHRGMHPATFDVVDLLVDVACHRRHGGTCLRRRRSRGGGGTCGFRPGTDHVGPESRRGFERVPIRG